MSGTGERLRSLIAEEIRRSGPISFERFMERALYEPGLGYYATRRSERGPGVDYHTSPQVGSIFARLLAAQIEECRRRLGDPDPFSIVEFGAGSLQLARGITAHVAGQSSGPRQARYLAVELAGVTGGENASVPLRTGPAGRSALPVSRVAEQEALAALADGGAVVISNEFVDALPVRRFIMRSGKLREIRVGILQAPAGAAPRGESPRFAEVEQELEPREAERLVAGIPELAEGFQFEINARGRTWMERVAGALSHGFVITFDYGYRRSERFRPEHASGTLLGYFRNRLEHDLFTRVGEQDLTSHVDYDDLIEAGNRHGLCCLGLTDQMRFLTALARRLGLLEQEPESAAQWRERLAFKELIRPGGMGTAFRVLIQATAQSLGPLTGLEDPFAR
ncbi:MAG: SAM-dependent methyltransferase [Acidobacteriota bacterium]